MAIPENDHNNDNNNVTQIQDRLVYSRQQVSDILFTLYDLNLEIIAAEEITNSRDCRPLQPC